MTPAAWICPRCHRVWGPAIPGCFHCNEPEELKRHFRGLMEAQVRRFEAMKTISEVRRRRE